MHRSSRLLAIVMGACIIIASASPGWAQQVPADQVQAAVDKGRDCLLKLQKADGSWEVGPQFDNEVPPVQDRNWGGYTALATYALLASGSNYTDAPMAKALTFLKGAKIIGVYAMGLRMQVWLLVWQQAKEGQDKATAGDCVTRTSADAETLLKWFAANKGQNAGLWDYLGKGDRTDHSVSQYGVLGLWAAAQMGGEIPDKVWKQIDERWRTDQFPDGGWAYSGTPAHPVAGDVGKPSMTAAGIATLFITQEYTRGDQGLKCTLDPNANNDNIATGLEHMAQIFGQVSDAYTFYGIERIGVASGYKYFGKVDWFASIARKLIASLGADGSMGTTLGNFPGNSVLTATSFSLLFLERGGAPVMMNKLDYSVHANGHREKVDHWDERPRDAFNLARWTGVEAEADNLNWQVVNLTVKVDDLHDAPIIYICGNQQLKFDEEDEDKLRQFVQEGGMILGNADCNSAIFAKSFRALGEKLLPKYEFKELGTDHLIYTGETYKPAKMRGHQTIFGLSNGVREMMLLLATGDPARAWQQNANTTQTSAFQIGSDIFQYAADAIGSKALRKKGDSYIVRPTAAAPAKTIKLARLMVGENPDPEPGGWARLTAILHNAPFGLGVTTTDVWTDVPKKPPEVLAGNYQVVHLTGTTAFKLDPAEQQILVDFVNKGGTLIIDAAGGRDNGVFADSAEAALQQMFPKEAGAGLKHALPLTDPVFNLPNAVIAKVGYRHFATNKLVESSKIPHIRGIEVDKRMAIFFSREDLSSGMVGEQVDGIFGYDPASATEIMRNLVLFAANPQPAAPQPVPVPQPPASQPAPQPPASQPVPQPPVPHG